MIDWRQNLDWVVYLIFALTLLIPIVAGFFSGWKRALYFGAGNLIFYVIGWILNLLLNYQMSASIYDTFHLNIADFTKDEVISIIQTYSGLIFMGIPLLVGNTILLIAYHLFFKRLLKIGKYEALKEVKKAKNEVYKVKQFNTGKWLLNGAMGTLIAYSTTLPITSVLTEATIGFTVSNKEIQNKPFINDIRNYSNSIGNITSYKYANDVYETTNAILAIIDVSNIRDGDHAAITKIFSDYIGQTFVNNLFHIIKNGEQIIGIDINLRTESDINNLKSSIDSYAGYINQKVATKDDTYLTLLNDVFRRISPSEQVSYAIGRIIGDKISLNGLPSSSFLRKYDLKLANQTINLIKNGAEDYTVYDAPEHSTSNGTFRNIKVDALKNDRLKVSQSFMDGLSTSAADRIFEKIIKPEDFLTNREDYVGFVRNYLSLFFSVESQSLNKWNATSVKVQMGGDSINNTLIQSNYVNTGLSQDIIKKMKICDGTNIHPYIIPLNLIYAIDGNNNVTINSVIQSTNIENVTKFFLNYHFSAVSTPLNTSFITKNLIYKYDGGETTDVLNNADFIANIGNKNGCEFGWWSESLPSADVIRKYTEEKAAKIKWTSELTYTINNSQQINTIKQEFYFMPVWF